MLTWGIDWATEGGDRGAVLVDWSTNPARVVDVRTGDKAMKDDRVLELLLADDAAAIAVDAPFGWPVDFHAFVRAHEAGPVANLPPPRSSRAWRIRRAARRETDRVVSASLDIAPLSVSFDRLGATAASWAVVEAELARCGVPVDRAGVEGLLLETYPAAVRTALGLAPGQRAQRIEENGFDAALVSPHARTRVRPRSLRVLERSGGPLGLPTTSSTSREPRDGSVSRRAA